MEDRIFAMVISGMGKKPLNSVEEGEAYKRLKAYGYDVKDIAKRVAKSLPHVYNMLKLADAPMTVKQRVINGEISGNTVLQLIKETKTTDELIKTIDDAVEAANADTSVDAEPQTESTDFIPTPTKQTGKKKKKATARHTGVLSPMKKFEAALIIADEKNYANIDLMQNLFTALNLRDSKPETIAKMFK